MKLIAAILVGLLLSGCATGDYDSYLKAQSLANELHVKSQKPLVEIEAVEGQQITGLKALRVYAPGTAPVVQQARPNEWATVVSQGLSVIGAVGGVYAGGKAAASLVKEVGIATTVGYAHVQSPASNVSNVSSITNSMQESRGVIGSGSYSFDSTHTPTVVNQPAPVVVQPAPAVIVPTSTTNNYFP